MTDQPVASHFHRAVPASARMPAHPAFALWGNGRSLVGFDVLREVPPGSIASLTQRITAFFAAHEDAGMLVGAVPYSRQAEDYLFQARTYLEASPGLAGAAAEPVAASLSMQPTADDYARIVSDALAQIGAGQYEKVVLSRSLVLKGGAAFDPMTLTARLSRDPSVVTFLASLPARQAGASRRIVGATPELLVRKRGAQISSHPLAGSARRDRDAGRDAENRERLLQSDKDLREHAAVVEAIADALSPFCSALDVPARPSAHSTASMWHLGTPIAGTLREKDRPVTDLLEVLHPTPAVCGMPRERADAAIGALEGYDRGFYAGAIGNVDRQGDGEFYVTLRCAEIEGDTARLYAGAGIVAGSDPEAEVRETSAKFTAMLTAFGLSEDASRPAR